MKEKVLYFHLQIEFTCRNWQKAKEDAKIFPIQIQFYKALVWSNQVSLVNKLKKLHLYDSGKNLLSMQWNHKLLTLEKLICMQ